jgi:hypothetical protein
LEKKSLLLESAPIVREEKRGSEEQEKQDGDRLTLWNTTSNCPTMFAMRLANLVMLLAISGQLAALVAADGPTRFPQTRRAALGVLTNPASCRIAAEPSAQPVTPSGGQTPLLREGIWPGFFLDDKGDPKEPKPRSSGAKGPLRVLAANPRYFTDGSGKAVFLTGSHTWGNLQDYTYADVQSPPALDFKAYLGFLKRHNHNFFRLWAWESSFNPKAKQSTIFYNPMPYQRPGPGTALDGKPRFDMTVFNQAYFDRLRNRVKAAGDEGIYVSVMLFQGFSIEGKGNVGGDPWQGHPYNPKNNVNKADGGGGAKVHTLSNRAVTKLQEAYVRKVIDTVNDLNNVLYEITNEDSGGQANTDWQIHIIRFIKDHEAKLPKQHPVGMTVQYPGGKDSVLLDSPADWISPAAQFMKADGRKVILNDTDHSYFWIGLKKDGIAAQRAWVWKNFTRGSQCLFMDPYLDPSHDAGRNDPAGGRPDSYWEPLRKAMGQTRKYANRMDLAAMVPHDDLVSSKYCLANVGKEYLTYLPSAGSVTVDLSAANGTLAVEWFDPEKDKTITANPVMGGSRREFKAPFSGEAVLYLKKLE